MIDKQMVERLITDLQQAAVAYDEIDGVMAAHAKAKAEHAAIVRELAQLRGEFSNLKPQYQELKRQYDQLGADINRRSEQLHRIDGEIAQAKHRAFGGA